jgi:2-oxo-3-hexenedioate decarboxylase
MIDPSGLADELIAAATNRRLVSPAPSGRDASFDLDAAYAVGDELMRRRTAAGHRRVGLKVGYANRAVWRALKMDTLVWGPMYDDTVRYAGAGGGALNIDRMVSPKIEPEIVFRMREPVPAGTSDPSAVLAATDWIALGFEIIDCPFPDWKFQPADFVAAFGLHAALFVGPPRSVNGGELATLVDELAAFKVRLLKDGDLAAEGAGRNALRSPALCVAELAAAIARRPGAQPLAAGDLVSTGTLTESQPLGAGETWTAEVTGIALSPVTLSTAAAET